MNFRRLLPGYRRAQEREMAEELAALEAIAGRRELGNTTLAAENARAVWGFPRLEGIFADFRYALRGLARQPGFAAVATLSLALGIGANTAIFSLADAVMWRALPVKDAERLVSFTGNSRSYFTYTGFATHGGQAMESVIAFSNFERKLDAGGGPRNGHVSLVTGNYFETLGVNAGLGRTLGQEDDRRGNPVMAAVISHEYWRREFGGERAVLGRSIHVERARYTVVGVAPPEFFGLVVGEAPDVWVPVTTLASIFPGENWLDQRNSNFLLLVGRLRPQVSARQAADILTPVAIEINLQRAGEMRKDLEARIRAGSKIKLEPVAESLSAVRYRFSKPLRVVLAMVAIVLLVAIVNVMGLQFARAERQRREVAVRLAIGAGRWRIVRQMLAESLLLATAGGAAGLIIYGPVATGLMSLMGARLEVGAHPRLLLFVAAVSIGSAVISGLVPALRATGRNLQPHLQQGARTATAPVERSLGRMVTVGQLALSLVLVAGACLFAASLYRLKAFDGGIDRRHLYLAEVDPAAAGYKDAGSAALDMRLRERLAALREVEAVSFSQNGIYSDRNYSTSFDVEGQPGESNNGTYDYVGPDFFRTLGTRVVAGRDFNERDHAGAPKVVIVNQEFVRKVFGGVNPIGRNLYIHEEKGKVAHRIVGVVREVRDFVRWRASRFYLCQLQNSVHSFSTCFLVRTGPNERATLPAIRAAIRQEDPALQVDRLVSADALLDQTLNTDRLLAMLGWGFAALAMTLAAVGIYGLLSHEVGRRTGEIGIRMALGARAADILRMVLREAAVLCIMGLALGTVAALGLSRLVQSLVFDLKSTDPRIELAAGVLLALVAAGAAWLPARRAARMDPMAALRHE